MSYELHINFISDMNSPYRIMTKKNENSKQRVIFYPANNVKKNCWRDDVKNLGQSYVAKVCVCVCIVFMFVCKMLRRKAEACFTRAFLR